MQRIAIAVILLAFACWPARIWGQYQPPSESLTLHGQTAYTWMDGQTNIVELDGPVTIELDRAKMTSGRAVVWLSPIQGVAQDQQNVQVVLLDDAVLEQSSIRRTGPMLFVTATVRGSIRIVADQRLAKEREQSPTFVRALEIRQSVLSGNPLPTTTPTTTPTATAASQPAEQTTPKRRRSGAGEPVTFEMPGRFQITRTEEGHVAVIVPDGITLYQRGREGDLLELQSKRAVLFTSLDRPSDAIQPGKKTELRDVITAVYLEGDVRIIYTPANAAMGEAKLEAERAYYDLATDRAILTDAVLHTIDPKQQMPIIVRARTIRQLALDDQLREYRAQDVQLTTSSFATPSYSIEADRAYVRQDNTAPDGGPRSTFRTENTTFDVFGVPIFYLPVVGGSITDQGTPLRQIQLENSNRFGFGARTQWGLFETLGRPHPPDLDVAYRLDYLGDRGPATGIDARYGGGFITRTTRDPWNFNGNMTGYVVYDHGIDDLGADRLDVDPKREIRGRFLWMHQHFFPDDWQVQLRTGMASDPTFLEEWFERDFYSNQPHDLSLYVKRQRGTEALTLAIQAQPNDFVTNADYLQEQFELEKLPEIGYHRIGDSFANDNLTFYSDNTVAGLRMRDSEASLLQQGFAPGQSPGMPAVGTTGHTDKYVGRGDFRQQVSFPFSAGEFKLAPYVLGRYITYSDSPGGKVENRVLGGAGVRMTTAFWAVDDSAQSDLLDIHRIRHVVEPELHLFTSAQTTDRNKVFIYDEDVDKVVDVSAIQLALHQRWQTKRGGPGKWRSVDFLTLNIEANYFANQPPDRELAPTAFRGLFFPTLPEASIPRQSINADMTWRISDTTALLSDVQYNWEKGELATASVGLAVSRDPRLSYYLGNRYIEELHSNIITAAIYYELSTKYALALSQSFDFGDSSNVSSSATLIRRFDRFYTALRFSYDATNDESSITLNILPDGVAYGLTTDAMRPSDR
ncbi:MAG: LPS assembly protein LptD [Phycisphaerales bacterium]|nr:LPS assembly protein LptD [Phycisphaerales bacterium]